MGNQSLNETQRWVFQKGLEGIKTAFEHMAPFIAIFIALNILFYFLSRWMKEKKKQRYNNNRTYYKRSYKGRYNKL